MSAIAHDIRGTTSAEEKFQLAVEACPNGMVMTDAAGQILLVNTETERLFGYRRDQLIGRSIEILLPERLRGGHLQHRAKFLLRAETRRMGANRDLFGRRHDGSEFPVEVALNPIRSRDGLLVLSAIIDISERKRMERMKDEFVSTVSHELRTPLTSIAASLGLLIGGAAGALPEPAARLIRIAESNSQRLIRLINDILDIEKIESGKIVFKFKRLEVRPLVEQVIEASRGYAGSLNARVRLEAAAAAAEVYADPDRLAQVITNFLANAIKFSPPGGEVVVSITQRGETVRIAVRDHGHGIPPAFRPRIFEKFAQADASDARQMGGTGLGLSIVKQIVSRLGGTVAFEDAAGGGTVFYVELPSWKEVAEQTSDIGASAAAPRVLLCEDNLDVALAVREGLRPAGLRTDFAHSAADAIAQAHADRYAAIVVDLDFPDGGIDLVRSLREQPPTYRTPIVVIGTDQGWDKAAEATGLNVLDYLPKPVNVEHMATMLGQAMTANVEGRARILHVDDDGDVLEIVAQTLGTIATVVSAGSIEAARSELLTNDFDLAILDIRVGEVSGVDLLPELRRAAGEPIPVIIFAAHATDLNDDPRVECSLDKSSSASLRHLVATVRDRLQLDVAAALTEVA
jgi:PAS domain S-box-containing protein